MTPIRPTSRASAPFAIDHPKLGPLRESPGTWIGTGFNSNRATLPSEVTGNQSAPRVLFQV